MSHHDPLYTVTQLAAELGVTVRTLHFYEAQGLITPRRVGNTRVYSQRECGRMILILRGKRLGFSLREIKEHLELYNIDLRHMQQARVLLKSVRAHMHRLAEQQVALRQTLEELQQIEQQAIAALHSMETAPATKTKPGAASTGTTL